MIEALYRACAVQGEHVALQARHIHVTHLSSEHCQCATTILLQIQIRSGSMQKATNVLRRPALLPSMASLLAPSGTAGTVSGCQTGAAHAAQAARSSADSHEEAEADPAPDDSCSQPGLAHAAGAEREGARPCERIDGSPPAAAHAADAARCSAERRERACGAALATERSRQLGADAPAEAVQGTGEEHERGGAGNMPAGSSSQKEPVHAAGADRSSADGRGRVEAAALLLRAQADIVRACQEDPVFSPQADAVRHVSGALPAWLLGFRFLMRRTLAPGAAVLLRGRATMHSCNRAGGRGAAVRGAARAWHRVLAGAAAARGGLLQDARRQAAGVLGIRGRF